jgi:hypothetical protein
VEAPKAWARGLVATALVASACGGRTPLDEAADAAQDAFAGRLDASSADGSASDRAAPADGGAGEASFDAGQDGDSPLCPDGGAIDDPCAPYGLTCRYPGSLCTCSRFCSGQCMSQGCESLGIECGPAVDPCSQKTLDCGTCPPPQTCGGGGIPGVCGGADACARRTCEQAGVVCGFIDDGCGGTRQCGACFWSCIPEPDGCPRSEPPSGTGCTIDGQTCSYPISQSSCCIVAYTCSGGVWIAGSPECRE